MALLLLAGAPPAAAAAPCWKRLINDWYDNGRIDKTYRIHCYREALDHLPQDVETYSSLSEDINRALQDAIRGGGGPGGSDGASYGGGPGGDATPGGADEESEPSQGLFRWALDKLGPSNADSIPLPLLILAALGLLLMAAGAAGMVARKLQTRRLQVRPASVPPASDRSLGP